jgi:hypothetical protein
MLWLLQCIDGESYSGESPVPQIRSIGQFILSRLFSSLNSGVLQILLMNIIINKICKLKIYANIIKLPNLWGEGRGSYRIDEVISLK